MKGKDDKEKKAVAQYRSELGRGCEDAKSFMSTPVISSPIILYSIIRITGGGRRLEKESGWTVVEPRFVMDMIHTMILYQPYDKLIFIPTSRGHHIRPY